MDVKGDFDPLIKAKIYDLLDKIERNETAFRDDLKKAYSIYSEGLEMNQLETESFQIGYVIGYFEEYFRDLTYVALQRKPSPDENNYFLQIIRSKKDKVLDILRR
jgi:hypothetical protein